MIARSYVFSDPHLRKRAPREKAEFATCKNVRALFVATVGPPTWQDFFNAPLAYILRLQWRYGVLYANEA